MLQKKFIVIYFLLSTQLFWSQIKKGDEFAAKAQYVRAIGKYKKAISGNSMYNQEAHLKLADCYRHLNDYENAEASYKKALAISLNVPAEVFFNYGQVLKTNNKYSEAADQYNRYIKLKPNDANAAKALKFCREIKYYLSKPIEYEVKNLEKVNTEKSEFSPVVFNNKLAFVAERESFNFVDYSVNDYNGEPYLNMYVTEIEGVKTKKTKTLSKKINTDYHDGPACLSTDGKTIYFTRVGYQKKKDFTNTAKIFIATGEERKWGNVQPFAYNSDNYSVAHPSISYDGSQLFFTSDMPGGYGGKDIWSCKKDKNGGWEKPVNLGPDINTSADEMFPTIREDGILYFSSNGLPGYGGLDVYSAKNIDAKWILIRNEGLNINSSYDDFGITFLNDSVGYFSSNRTGGKGKDDIYWFKYTNKAFTVNGTVLLTENGNPAKNVLVVLADDKGKRIDSMKTNQYGNFEFKTLAADRKYMAIVETDDPQFSGKARYFLADKNKVVQRVTNKQGNEKFVFKNLPFDPNALPDLATDDNLTLAGNMLYGENPSKPIKNTKLKLVNEHGDVVEETVTNEFGAFAFRNIPSDQNYMISVEESDINLPAGTKVTLTNKSGKELKTFTTGQGKFSFKVLNSDKSVLKEMDVDDVNLAMEVFGFMYDQDKKPIAKAKLKVREENGKGEAQEVVTNEQGRFNFKNLHGDKNYLFETAENDPALNGVKKVYIADSKGRMYKVLEKTGGKFSFKMLEADKNALGEFVVDDPWLQVLELKKKDGLTIIENIYYASGDYKLDAAGQNILDKVIGILQRNPDLMIELSSHTDSKSSDEFNLALSKKRAQFAVDYIVSKGIDKKRLKAVGFGETKLLNRCANGVDCSDEEHGKNRRTEFKITEMPKKEAPKNKGK